MRPTHFYVVKDQTPLNNPKRYVFVVFIIVNIIVNIYSLFVYSLLVYHNYFLKLSK